MTYPRTQAVVPVDDQGRFIDCGRWREKGVTHWHCLYEEWLLRDNKIRFDNDRVREAKMKPTAVAFTPQDACDWIMGSFRSVAGRSSNTQRLLERARLITREDWHSHTETTFFLLMHGRTAGGGLLISEGRSADSVAYPMTGADCATCVVTSSAPASSSGPPACGR